jgi:hypothetical protein
MFITCNEFLRALGDLRGESSSPPDVQQPEFDNRSHQSSGVLIITRRVPFFCAYAGHSNSPNVPIHDAHPCPSFRPSA